MIDPNHHDSGKSGVAKRQTTPVRPHKAKSRIRPAEALGPAENSGVDVDAHVVGGDSDECLKQAPRPTAQVEDSTDPTATECVPYDRGFDARDERLQGLASGLQREKPLTTPLEGGALNPTSSA